MCLGMLAQEMQNGDAAAGPVWPCGHAYIPCIQAVHPFPALQRARCKPWPRPAVTHLDSCRQKSSAAMATEATMAHAFTDASQPTSHPASGDTSIVHCRAGQGPHPAAVCTCIEAR